MTSELLNGFSKLVFAVATLVAALALLMFSMGNARALQTTAVHLGMNPAVSFYCYSNNTYTVPTGSDLIITDISAGDYLTVRSDSTTIWTHYGNYSNTSKHNSLSSGFVAPSGTVVSCASSPGYLAGYLVKS